MTSPIRPTDNEARELARQLVDRARFAALATLEDGRPMVSRVAIGTDGAGAPVSLISELSQHTKALKSDARASLLLGEPGDKGDPLTHPRLTLQCRTILVPHDDAEFRDSSRPLSAATPEIQTLHRLCRFPFCPFRRLKPPT